MLSQEDHFEQHAEDGEVHPGTSRISHMHAVGGFTSAHIIG